MAVLGDERSYSHGLFAQAEGVLRRIHKPVEMIGQFSEMVAKIKVWKIAP